MSTRAGDDAGARSPPAATGLANAARQAVETPDARAARLLAAMTLQEKLTLVHTQYGVPLRERPAPNGALGSAGFNVGIPRLDIPPLEETDAGLGIANPTNAAYDATALPASLLLGATFDPELARAAGAIVGAEARAMGFSVVLGGGANLIREPRGGRNFEYVSEDPLLTGLIAGAQIAGVQSNRVVSTLKHYALNAQENGRVVLDARLGEAALRESDFLAFELALEQGSPGAVMTAYNKVNGTYASENAPLINSILKTDWGFRGWVMSDWGGTHSSGEAALAGLDQESGQEDDTQVFFDTPLERVVRNGRVPMARLDDMVTRILRTEIAAGVIDDVPRRGGAIDFAAHAATAERIAAQGIVLLKNDGDVLPIAAGVRRLLVVGGHADIGVLSGGGSSQVVPRGSIRFEGVPPKMFFGKPRLFDPSSPLAALRSRVPGRDVRFVDGSDKAATLAAARDADMILVFADRWANESLDLQGLALTDDRDTLIEDIAAANANTVVVLESTGAVGMPWLNAVRGVVEAWYPGEQGGEAIADVLLGTIVPSGRLPVTFPATEAELPRPRLPDHDKTASYPSERQGVPSFQVDYDIEGADVGYKWYLRTGRHPLFPFGHGLSYTRFSVSGLTARERDGTLSVEFDVRNEGTREGIDTPQLYLGAQGFTRRLVGFSRVRLAPGETRHVTLAVDPRLTATYDVAAHGWHVARGPATLAVRENAFADAPTITLDLPERNLPARHGFAAEVAGVARP